MAVNKNLLLSAWRPRLPAAGYPKTFQIPKLVNAKRKAAAIAEKIFYHKVCDYVGGTPINLLTHKTSKEHKEALRGRLRTLRDEAPHGGPD